MYQNSHKKINDDDSPLNITIIGGGYVGLVSGCCLSSFGFDVSIIETDIEKFKKLQKNISPIFENGLDQILKEGVAHNLLHFYSHIDNHLDKSDIVFIAVGTPMKDNAEADLSYILNAVSQVAQNATHDLLIITKSTVPIGTSRKIKKVLQKKRPDLNFEVAANPEFLREGNALYDFQNPDRIIIGLEDENNEKSKLFFKKLYKKFDPQKLIFMSLESAELTKYAANAFLAMKVTFINEISNLSEALHADINKISTALGLDPRIGSQFLKPGPGYGGSCFPKDTNALCISARQIGYPTELIEKVIDLNIKRQETLARKILQLDNNLLKDKQLSILGLTFKADTDDLRDSPALTITQFLAKYSQAKIKAWDPIARQKARYLLPKDVILPDTLNQTIEDADILIILTEWKIFSEITPYMLKKLMNGKIIIDYRNIWSKELMIKNGFIYKSLGQ